MQFNGLVCFSFALPCFVFGYILLCLTLQRMLGYYFFNLRVGPFANKPSISTLFCFFLESPFRSQRGIRCMNNLLNFSSLALPRRLADIVLYTRCHFEKRRDLANYYGIHGRFKIQYSYLSKE